MPTRDTAAGRVGGLARHRPADDPDLLQARTELATVRITEYVAEMLATAPPLGAEQVRRIVRLLPPVTADVAGAA